MTERIEKRRVIEMRKGKKKTKLCELKQRQRDREERNSRKRVSLRAFYTRKRGECARQTSEIANTTGYESNGQEMS